MEEQKNGPEKIGTAMFQFSPAHFFATQCAPALERFQMKHLNVNDY